MRSKLNYTGRKRIPKKNVAIHVTSDTNGVSEFKLELDLPENTYPDNTKIYLEAYYRSSVMRFSLGTIRDFENPFSEKLGEIQSEVVFFRIKLVDETESVGKILAIVDGISPGSDLQRASLLPVSYRDLGDRIWRLELDGPAPVLEVNNNFDSPIAIGEIVRKDPSFLTLVLPAVLRSILEHILYIDGIEDLDGDSWQNQWLKAVVIVEAENFHL